MRYQKDFKKGKFVKGHQDINVQQNLANQSDVKRAGGMEHQAPKPELHFWKVSSLCELLKEAILNGGQYELFQKEGRHKTGADIYTAASLMRQQQTETECLGNLLLRTASLLTFTSDFTFQCTHCAMGIWWQHCRQLCLLANSTETRSVKGARQAKDVRRFLDHSVRASMLMLMPTPAVSTATSSTLLVKW